MFFRAMWATLAAISLLVGLTGQVQASSVDCTGGDTPDAVCEDTRTVVGQDFTIFNFTIEEQGFYDLTLIDYVWPTAPLASLSALLTTSKDTVAELGEPGSLMFFAAPGEYFLQVFAATSMDSPVGLYGFSIVASPVPLPSALLLLGSALALFMATNRRRREGTDAGLQLQPA